MNALSTTGDAGQLAPSLLTLKSLLDVRKGLTAIEMHINELNLNEAIFTLTYDFTFTRYSSLRNKAICKTRVN